MIASNFPGVPLKIAGRRPAIFQCHFVRGWRSEVRGHGEAAAQKLSKLEVCEALSGQLNPSLSSKQ